MKQTSQARPGLRPFLLRMHFYIGLFVGPFLLVAALTGALYVLTPQIETRLYSDALSSETTGPARSIADQAAAARAYLDAPLDVSAIRPAPAEGMTTRIMFSDPALAASENRTVFVDPVTLAIRGDLTTYGTSGILPFRITLDYLHRNLMLGEWGRYYSELAASWLWVVVLGGVALWLTGPSRRRGLGAMPPAQRHRWIHATLGVSASLVLLFLSVTGLTWSQGAGARIDAARAALGWVTPSVTTAPGHAEHHHHEPAPSAREDRLAEVDAVITAARMAGLDSPMVEVRMPRPGHDWLVREYDRSWPTQVDTIALDPATLAVTGRADFAEFPLVAKLIRWGVDAHMGVLFGVANQILMAAAALVLCTTTVYGYRIWWRRRPAPGPLAAEWARLPAGQRLIWPVVAIAVGWALPVLGVSLALFAAIDLLRWRMGNKAAAGIV